jgi:uncharacterized protein
MTDVSLTTEPRPDRNLVAPVWHTVLFLVFLGFYALFEVGRVARLEASHSSSRLPQYLFMICFELAIVGYVWLGLRPGGTTLARLIGGKWRRWTDVLRDIGIAFLFWLLVVVFLIGARFAFGRDELSLRAVRILAPRGAIEMIAWCMVAIAAGVCEEIVFRGYLQRQFLAVTGRTSFAIVLQAVIFGTAHTYKGYRGMITIAIYGALFGVLAVRRKSLRPGIMQHTVKTCWPDLLPTCFRRAPDC